MQCFRSQNIKKKTHLELSFVIEKGNKFFKRRNKTVGPIWEFKAFYSYWIRFGTFFAFETPYKNYY